MTENAPEAAQIKIRIDPTLLAQIDERIAAVNELKPHLKLSRSSWFENMARWIIERLPHEAVRSDLVAAWPDAPVETLGIDR